MPSAASAGCRDVAAELVAAAGDAAAELLDVDQAGDDPGRLLEFPLFPQRCRRVRVSCRNDRRRPRYSARDRRGRRRRTVAAALARLARRNCRSASATADVNDA